MRPYLIKKFIILFTKARLFKISPQMLSHLINTPIFEIRSLLSCSLKPISPSLDVLSNEFGSTYTRTHHVSRRSLLLVVRYEHRSFINRSAFHSRSVCAWQRGLCSVSQPPAVCILSTEVNLRGTNNK
jgi:hypothetical protein